MSITEFTRQAIEKKDTGQAFFIGLQKAFDTLDHRTLMRKIEKYGYRGKIHDLIKNYLQNRWQFVSVNGSSTQQVPITTDVPQRSVLGLF